MKKHLLLPLLLLLVSLFSSMNCGSAAGQANTGLIAGQSIGKVNIGYSRSHVLKQLGKPTVSDKNGKYTYDSFGTSAKENIVGVLYEYGKVVQISTIYPRFRTKEGVGRDSLWPVVNKYYKPLRVFSIGSKKDDPEHVFNYYVSSNKGIAFLMDNAGWPAVTTKETSVFRVIVFRKKSHPLVAVGRSLRQLK